MGKTRELYLPVYCPSPKGHGRCNHFLLKIAVAHHCLVGLRCSICGTVWRIFHGSDEITIEMSKMDQLVDSKLDPVLEISWGKKAPEKPRG